MTKQLIGTFLSAVALSAAAVPELKDYTVEQNADRMVVVSFTLTEKAILTMDVLTNGVSIGAENYQTVRDAMSNDDKFPCNKVVPAGSHVFTWRPVKEWPGYSFDKGELSVEVKAWSFDSPPDYMVIDYNVKSNAIFYAKAEDIPGGIKTVADPNNIDEETLAVIKSDVYRLSKMIFRKIPAAGVKWAMGSPEDETYHRSDEIQHYVTLTNDYYVSIYPMTRAHHKRFFQTQDANSELNNPYPRGSLSYTGARGSISSYCWPEDGHNVAPGSYIGKMRARTGFRFDFLTEAEWEYACRAGSDQPWNGYAETEVAWTTLGTASASSANYIVGLKKPNAWGLYDMHGMVNEWVLDQYGEYPTSAVIAPVGVTTNANLRILRGGVINMKKSDGRYTSAISTRSAFRYGFNPGQSTTGAPNPIGARLSCPASLPDWMRE